MPSTEIVTIGTEILLGEIVDTNATYLARNLRDIGIDLYRKTTVGDNSQRIAIAIREAMERCDIIITTGGLGPTVDDPTREAIALALGVTIDFHQELWEQIEARFRRYGRQPTENNKRQAYIPNGAIAVENPVGTAPAFIVETQHCVIFSLPGVPSEMAFLYQNAVVPYLQKRFKLTGIIKARTLHTAGVGESQIDVLIGDLESLTNPTVGLAAHSGQVDIRIAAKANSETEADDMIRTVEEDIRRRLGKVIYGVDGDRLEAIALRMLKEKGWTLAVVEAGLNGELVRRLSTVQNGFQGGEVLQNLPAQNEMMEHAISCARSFGADVGLGVVIYPAGEKQDVFIVIISPSGTQTFTRPYGGPPEYAPKWALNHCLDLIRNL